MVQNPMEQLDNIIKQYEQDDLYITELLCDRHPQENVALYYENSNREKSTYTFGELSTLSKKFATVLQQNGIRKGDGVAVLLPKGPEILITVLAIWRLGAVNIPLFTAFGPDAISYRVTHSKAKAIVTDSTNRKKLQKVMEIGTITDLPVITTDPANNKTEQEFWTLIDEATPIFKDTAMSKDDMFILLYTSGTTGHPKGVEVPVRACSAFEGYMRFGLDMKQDDIFWNIADPGWAYGLYFGVVGPMLIGQSIIMLNAKFDVDETFRILQDYEVTNFAAAPTVYRVMRINGNTQDLENLKLRTLSSAGEPLNPDVSHWAQKNLGIPIYDQFGQTELGMAVNNHHHPNVHSSVKEGSMGIALPGYRAVVVDEKGNELAAGVEGELAIDVEHSPVFWFRGYYNDKKRTNEQFVNNARYYLTCDAASKDENDAFYFSGRSDDIITSSGYKIGPFEVESCLMEHEAVAETTVIGVPDEQRGEIVKAFVVLRPEFTESNDLKETLKNFVKNKLSAHEYPREIEFIKELPKTPSGKIQRYLLR